jgi:hypothetical protein
MVKNKNAFLAKEYLDQVLKTHSKHKLDFVKLPEIKILRELLVALEKKDDEKIKLCFNILIEKLVLFESEIDLLKTFAPKQKEIEQKGVVLSREELAKRNKFNMQLDQEFGIIQKKMPDIRREKKDRLKKRILMKNRIYTDAIKHLEERAFIEAGSEYLKLSYTLSKRKNFEISSLMVLLHGLALLKANEPLKKIRINIKSYLTSLGLNKKLLKDTYPIRCIEFILKVNSHKVEKYLPTIKEILEILPFFEEEKMLIEDMLKEE